MAPTLTSNSFLLTSTPHSRLNLSNRPGLAVFAKRSPFQLGKPKENPEESRETAGSAPFRFNFGKVPDLGSLVPVTTDPSSGISFGNPRRKDPATVFVAGATGQAGIRIARTLLRKGFSVRAGVPDLSAAQELARLAASYKLISNEESRRLNAVESTFQEAQLIAKAIGNAGKVVVTIGASENGPTAEVSMSDALQVIKAAKLAGVGHVAIIYDGNTAGASTYNVLDGITSFFNNLFSQSQLLTIPEFLQKVIEADVSYTFIKTSLTDDFSPESNYNVVVSAEGSASAYDYKVAKSKIASLVADVFSNTAVAENKVVEVFSDPSAPLKRVDELFSAIPEDGRRAAYAEANAKAKAEEEARIAAQRAQEAVEAAKKLEEEVQKLSEQEARAASLATEAQEKAEAAGASIENLLNKAKNVGSGLSWVKLSSQITSVVQIQKPLEKPKVQIATFRGQAKARSLPSQKAVMKSTNAPKALQSPFVKPKEEQKPKAKGTEEKREVRKIFGGLFQQETIYVDDD